jgi:hypothetical protein
VPASACAAAQHSAVPFTHLIARFNLESLIAQPSSDAGFDWFGQPAKPKIRSGIKKVLEYN